MPHPYPQFPSDLEILDSARRAHVYSGRKNSLVEWTLSDAWTDPKSSTLARPFMKSADDAPTASGEISC